jgi:hypothetical protein
MNWNVCGRKGSWPDLRYCPRTFLGGSGKRRSAYPNTSRNRGRLNQLARLKICTGENIIKMDMNSV